MGKPMSSTFAFDVCRAYVAEAARTWSAEVRKIVDGALRARDLHILCKASSLCGHEYQPVVFAQLRQVEAFFKKNVEFSDDERCQRKAVENFHAAEKRCRITNKRLDWFYVRRDRLDPWLNQVLFRMERGIENVLGDLRDMIDGVPDAVRLTNGATSDRTRPRSLPFLKISGKLRAPKAMFPLLRTLATHWGVPGLRLIGCEYNRIAFVPKNWATHRTIACEPTGALPIQLVVDKFVKRCLRKWGIDLSSQAWNQELARVGSLTGEYCTVDLEWASDCLAMNALAWLLPPEWYRFLCTIRSSCYQSEVLGSGVYAKFSSMGNGCTFTLETLVFAAACLAIGAKPREFAVYGDDLIVKTELYGQLTAVLRFLGFRTNGSKSFSTGVFRESCGADWVEGRNVTPFYLRNLPKNDSEWSHVVNGLQCLGIPKGPLWRIARSITLGRAEGQKPLLIVPYTDCSTMGVWIDVRAAYRMKCISTHLSTPKFWAYGAVPVVRINRGQRSLFSWFLQPSELEIESPKTVDGGHTRPSAMEWSRKVSARVVTAVGLGNSWPRKVRCVYFPAVRKEPCTLSLWTEYLITSLVE